MRYAMILLVFVTGCAQTFKPQSFSDALGAADSSISTAAVLVYELCLNSVPGGPCAEDALIDTDAKEDYAAALRDLAREVDTVKAVWRAGGAAGDWRSLDALQLRLNALIKELQTRENDDG